MDEAEQKFIALVGQLCPAVGAVPARRWGFLRVSRYRERGVPSAGGRKTSGLPAATEQRLAGITINPDQQVSPVQGIAGSRAARVGFVRWLVLQQLLFLAVTAAPRPAR